LKHKYKEQRNKEITFTGNGEPEQVLADQLFQMCKYRAFHPYNLGLQHLVGWLKQKPRVSLNFSHYLLLVALLPAGIVPEKCLVNRQLAGQLQKVKGFILYLKYNLI
jgi:hypothetical protein